MVLAAGRVWLGGAAILAVLVLAAGHRPVPATASGRSTAGRWWPPPASRRVTTVCSRLAVEPGRRGASASRLPLRTRGRGLLPLAVPQHDAARRRPRRRAPRRCGTAATPATSAEGCGPSAGSAPPARWCRPSLARGRAAGAARRRCAAMPARRRRSRSCWAAGSRLAVAAVAAPRAVASGRGPLARPAPTSATACWPGAPGPASCSASVVVGGRARRDLPDRGAGRRVDRVAGSAAAAGAARAAGHGRAGEHRRLGSARGRGGVGVRRGRARRGPGRRRRGGVRRAGARRQPARCRRARGASGCVGGSRADRATGRAAGRRPSPSREGAGVAERPYTLLSCGMSIDGYLDSATDAAAGCCPTTPTSTGSTRCAPTATRSWSAPRPSATTTRGCWCARRRGATSGSPAGCAPSPIKVTVTERAQLDAVRRLLRHRRRREAGLLRAARRWPRRGTGSGRSRPWSTAAQPVDMRRLSEDLCARGVRRLMVEGGGKVHTQFLTADLADELHLVVAPFFVGDSAGPAVRRRRPVPVEPGPACDAGRGATDRRRRAAALRTLRPFPDGLTSKATMRQAIGRGESSPTDRQWEKITDHTK